MANGSGMIWTIALIAIGIAATILGAVIVNKANQPPEAGLGFAVAGMGLTVVVITAVVSFLTWLL